MRKIPSIKTLSRVFGEKAKDARVILEMTRSQLDELPAGAARNRECYHRPKTYDVRLHCLDALEGTGTYGVNSFETRDKYVDYLDTGETYADTLIYDGRYSVVCLGTYIERHGK